MVSHKTIKQHSFFNIDNNNKYLLNTQINIVEWFRKDHLRLKTRVNLALPSHE